MQCNENKWSEKVAQEPKYVLESIPIQIFLNFVFSEMLWKLPKNADISFICVTLILEIANI